MCHDLFILEFLLLGRVDEEMKEDPYERRTFVYLDIFKQW